MNSAFLLTGRTSVLFALLLLGFCCACGSGQGNIDTRMDAAIQLDAAPTTNPALSLPPLDSLPEPGKAASLSGPGWFPVPILEQGVMSARGGGGTVKLTLDGLSFQGAGDATWAIFGVYGFDGDNQPTSIQLESSNLDGTYYVGVSSYADGRWEFAGPFSSDEPYEYKNASAYSDPEIYVSGKGYHYIAVVLEGSDSMTLNGIQLGVDGGDNAPVAPLYFETSIGSAGMHFWWNPSPDHNDPDFAGYVMERALWPGTDFVGLVDPSRQTYFHDGTADPALKYRYRLRAEDVSGNSSWGISSTIFGHSGDNHPVPVLDMPSGPLYGAQMVTFDLSGSYDPDGEAMTEYTIKFDNSNGLSGIAPLVSIDPMISILLQPGCYSVRASAKSSTYSQAIMDTLKVYPVWQQSPQLVAAPGTGQWRMQRNRSIYWPQQDSIVTFYNDYLGPGLGALVQHADGSREFLQVPYYLYEIDWISEPVIWQGRPYVGIVSGGAILLADIGPGGLEWSGGISYTSFDNIDLVVDGEGQLRICTLNEYNPGDFEILAINAANPEDFYTLEDKSNSDGPFDVEWNPELGGFELVFTTIGSLHWNRTDEEGGLAGTGFVGAGIYDSVDVELHPDGSPAVMGPAGGSFTYFSYDETGGTWSAPEVIEPLGVNGKVGDLIYDGNGMAAFFGKVAGQSSLYRRNGGSWDPQTVDWALLSGQHCAIALWPDGRVNIIDGTVGGALFISDFNSDGSHPAPLEIPSVAWQGLDLNAIAGADGIHAVWRDDNGAQHYIADVNGTNWTSAAGFASSDALELMADSNGKVFIGNTHGSTADLFSWFGGAWLIEGSSNRWGSSLPYLAAQRDAPGGQFMVHDDVPVPPALQHMHDDGGGFLVFDTYDFDSVRIDEGSSLYTPGGLISFVRGDEIFGSEGLVGFIANDDHSFSHQFHADNYFGNVDLTRGRRMDASNYIVDGGATHSAFWTTGREGGLPGITRFSGQAYNGKFNVDATQAITDPLVEGAGQGLHTVSAATAWGYTALAIGDQFRAGGGWLEWSNFGDFESLPLPPLDMQSSCMHELVVGLNGRWHVLYRDKRDGAIYVISTS